jgi:hypothetical protein
VSGTVKASGLSTLAPSAYGSNLAAQNINGFLANLTRISTQTVNVTA